MDTQKEQVIKEMYEKSELRKNVLHWYPIEKESTILQIGLDSYKIAEELCNKAKEVVVIVNSEEQKKYLLQNVQKENLEIRVVQNLQEQEHVQAQEKKFDYVSLIGSVEIYKDIIENKAYKRLEKLLEVAKQNCKENGKILLAIDNKYGMKYWTTMYAQKNILCNQTFALSKTMIDELLKKEGLDNFKYYYMLPDYKIANVIFTEKYFPNTESISRNFTYGEEKFVTFNQTEAYGEILKESPELFKLYANSFFIEISKQKLEENNIKFVSYTNIRKDKYRIQTIIYDDRVEKMAVSNTSKQHIEEMKRNISLMKKMGIKTLDSYEDNKIISKYVENAKSYDKILLEYLEKEEKEKFFEKVEDYKIALLQKLEKVEYTQVKEDNIFTKYNLEVDHEHMKEFNFVKNGLWDLIFQNIFYIDNDLYFYDQEWYDNNVPIEYIIYRAIAYFPSAHAYVPTKELYETLKIDKYVEEFQKLDNKIQDEIRNEEMWELHRNSKTGQTLMDLYNNLETEFKEYKSEIDLQKTQTIRQLRDEKIKDQEEIESLKQTVERLKNEKQRILDSTSWKITKPIRWLGKGIKK